MTKQFLDAAEVGSAVKEVGGEAMSQGVGAGGGCEAGGLEVCLEQSGDATRGEPRPALVQEDGLFARLGWLSKHYRAIEPVHGHFANRAKSLAATLAANAEKFLFEIDVV